MIKDSGARREFSSGAVRDVAEGKGRCDLLPLHEVAEVLAKTNPSASVVLDDLGYFLSTGDTSYINVAIRHFIEFIWGVDYYTAIIGVSKQYEDGATKYDERNWEKGIPCHCYIDSGIRHMLKYLRGDDDEPHERACVWNLLGLAWTIQHRPEMNDLEYNKTLQK